MKRRFDEYVRLARGIFGVSSVWLGPRDLLYVRGTGVVLGFVEEYVCFELARIQSVAVIRTWTGLVLNLVYGGSAAVLGVLAGASILKGLAVSGELEALFYLAAGPPLLLSGASLGLLIINLALGPTCHFQIQTATRIERLRPLRRLRVARRVQARLVPALAAAQGGPGGAGGAETFEVPAVEKPTAALP